MSDLDELEHDSEQDSDASESVGSRQEQRETEGPPEKVVQQPKAAGRLAAKAASGKPGEPWMRVDNPALWIGDADDSDE